MPASGIGAAFPNIPSSIVNVGPDGTTDGYLTPAWQQFFVNLWRRTGGGSGDASTILDTITNTPGNLLYRGATTWDGASLSTILDLFIDNQEGDLIQRTSTDWGALRIGVEQQVLTVHDGVPVWSGLPIVNLANYTVHDGITDDSNNIQTALNAGSIIFVPEFTYAMNTPVNVPSTVAYIFGPGVFSFIGTPAPGQSMFNVAGFSGPKLIVEGPTFTGNSPSLTPWNITGGGNEIRFLHCKWNGFYGTGVATDSAVYMNCSIQDCVFVGTYTQALNWQAQSNSFKFMRNKLTVPATSSANAVSIDSGVGGQHVDTMVADNVITGGNASFVGISIVNGVRAQVARNNLAQFLGDGIHVDGLGGTSQDCQVYGNTISSAQNGIVSNANTRMVAGAVVNLSIWGNYISNAGSVAIVAQCFSGSTFTGLRVQTNYGYDPGVLTANGIVVQLIDVSGALVEDNYAYSDGSNMPYGFVESHASGTSPNNNIFTDNVAIGVTSQHYLTLGASSVIYEDYQAGPGLTFLRNATLAAGGTNGFGLTWSSTTAFGLFGGTGAPTLFANQGSLYLRSDASGTSNLIYVNTSSGLGNTWTAIGSGAATTPGTPVNSVQVNVASAFGGFQQFEFDGTTLLVNANNAAPSFDHTFLTQLIGKNGVTQQPLTLDSYLNLSGGSPEMSIRTAEGTYASPSGPNNNANLGQIGWRPYNNGAFITSPNARIWAKATEAQTSGHRGAQLRFGTTKAGTTSLADTVVFWDTNGIQIIGTTFANLTGAIGSDGTVAYITDANVNQPGRVITAGGGSFAVMAYSSGSSWRVMGSTGAYPFASIYLAAPSGGDDSATVQAALNTGSTLYLGPGTWKFNNVSSTTNGQWIYGDSQGGTIIDYNGPASPSGTNILTFNGVNYAGCSRMTFQAKLGNVMTAGTFALQATGCDQFEASYITVDGAGSSAGTGGKVDQGIGVTCLGLGYYHIINNFRSNFCNNAGVYIKCSSVCVVNLVDGNIGGQWGASLTAGNSTQYGVYIEDSSVSGVNANIIMINVQTLATYGWGMFGKGHASVLTNRQTWVYALNCGADTCGLDCWNFSNLGFWGVQCWAGNAQGSPATTQGNGFTFAGCGFINLSSCRGLLFNSCFVFVASGTGDINITGCWSAWGNVSASGLSTSFAGIYLNNTTGDVTVTGNVINNSVGGTSAYACGCYGSVNLQNAIIKGNYFVGTTAPVIIAAGGSNVQVDTNGAPWTVAQVTTNLAVGPCVGSMVQVTDQTAAPAWGSNAAGGGAVKAMLHCNGANWTVAAI